MTTPNRRAVRWALRRPTHPDIVRPRSRTKRWLRKFTAWTRWMEFSAERLRPPNHRCLHSPTSPHSPTLPHSPTCDADEFLKQAKRKFLGRVVQVRNLRSKFCLPLYTAPDGHKIRNLPALTPGELVQITEVRTSSDLSRVAGRTVLPNPDSPEDCLWVNLWSKFNLHGEQPRNGVWYVQRPS